MTDAKEIAKARSSYIHAMDILGCLKRVDRIPWVSIHALRDDEKITVEVAYKEDPLNTYGVVAPRLFRELTPSPEATETTEGKDLEEIMEGDYHLLLHYLKKVYPKIYRAYMDDSSAGCSNILPWLHERWPNAYDVIGAIVRAGRIL